MPQPLGRVSGGGAVPLCLRVAGLVHASVTCQVRKRGTGASTITADLSSVGHAPPHTDFPL